MSDSELLAEAYVKEISNMPQPSNHPEPQYEGNMGELADSIEDAAQRLAGVIRRDVSHPGIEAALRHIRGVLADLVEYFDGPGSHSSPEPEKDEVVPNVKRF